MKNRQGQDTFRFDREPEAQPAPEALNIPVTAAPQLAPELDGEISPQEAFAAAVRRKRNAVAPKFLVEWEPFWPSFLANVADEVLRREQPPLRVNSAPGEFWPDVFVKWPVPWKSYGQSFVANAALVVFVIATSSLWDRSRVQVQDLLTHTVFSYYPTSDYLPPIESPAPRPKAKVSSKGDPEFAKQEIISVPPVADNSAQTIINPPFPKVMKREVPLPNMVVESVVPGPPSPALTRSKITLPDMAITPIAPAPKVIQRAKMPDVPQPDVIQPAPEVTRNKPSDIQLAELQPEVDSPKLPVNVERAKLQSVDVPMAQPIAPPVSTGGVDSFQQAKGRLMALNVRPEPPQPKIEVPDGSKHGAFAATPSGHVGAAGTPEVQGATQPGNGGAQGNGDTASPARGTAKESGTGTSGQANPTGITIRGGTLAPGDSAVVGK